MVPWNVFFKLLVMQLGASIASEEETIRQFLDFTRNGYVSAYEFSVFLKWFGSLSVCVQRMLDAVNGGLISGFVPALEAVMLLEGKRNGTYLVRMSKTHAGSFAITFVDSAGAVKHCVRRGTPVTLACGLSRRIERVDVGAALPAWRHVKRGSMVPSAAVSHRIDQVRVKWSTQHTTSVASRYKHCY